MPVPTPTELNNLQLNITTYDEVVNGPPNVQIKSRLGRYIWTLATIGYKLEIINQQANAVVNAIQATKNLVDQTASAATGAINTARDNVQHLLEVKLNEMEDAIDEVAAVKSQENGWIATAIADASGRTQQQINDKTALFYNTVADMVADTKLKAGKAVITHGYYAPNDGGGARYLIKDTATDYSIPVANNLHAVFADSFDIRKFGIRNSATLDQTTEIQRMVNYADSRVYEIDFLNYKLMTPKTTVNYKTGSGIGRGMAFSYVHKLKNLFIANDKTKTLQQGDCCIFFLPKTDGIGIFELDNVTFDPYVANYNITSGDADGYMFGFGAAWHKDFTIGWPANQQFMTGYEFVANDITFISPANSYNMNFGVWSPEVRVTNIKGEYWGLFIVHFADALYAENVHGIFRDDLHAPSGRHLVTNLFQEEQEVGGSDFAYTQKIQSFKNISCYKHSDKSVYSAIKRQVMGKPTLKKWEFEDVIGDISVYPSSLIVNKIIVNRCDRFYAGDVLFDSMTIENSTFTDLLLRSNIPNSGKITINNSIVPRNIFWSGSGIVNSIEFNHCTFSGTQYICYIKNYVANDCTYSGRCLDGQFDNATFNNCHFMVGTDMVAYTDNTISNLNIYHCTAGNFSLNLCGVRDASNMGVNLVAMQNAFIKSPRWTVGNTGTVTYTIDTPYINATKTYDPPSLATATQQSTTVTLAGAKLGDNVNVSFNQPLQGTRMWGEVTANNQVTVYHRNDTGAAVDLPSGMLTVKIV